jgi:FixJ family two-component response regulator
MFALTDMAVTLKLNDSCFEQGEDLLILWARDHPACCMTDIAVPLEADGVGVEVYGAMPGLIW